jgi:2-C-methyl-D-erythritol 4-phosphate cytidylyltransferase
MDYNHEMSTIAVILAGGSGTRFRGSEPKQFLKIGDRTLLEICLQRFQEHGAIDGMVLVCPEKYLSRSRRAAEAFSKVIAVHAGGETRQESSAIGVGAAAGAGNVLIHDAARALVPAEVVTRVLEALGRAGAVMPVVAAGDTTVRTDEAGAVTAVLDRGWLRQAQTPQGFRLDLIRRAHEMAKSEGFADASDDCSLVLRYKLAPVVTVEGDPKNIKITYSQDLNIAKALL